ncbi:hypothetical protein BMF94_5470 [Rhodotorula taiwanensis]|uniref:Uncharacterized protein n=1 Tax=Rhodotorula taiwanensis TaxID=741276 RepID=A0A2S5B313_9BASI|nr:hypothetical protein BMF94_5470 [Rhodotorula taiwanensis]
MTVKKAITVLIGLITLILVGTVIVLSTVVQYFGVDKRDVIQDYEMALVERLANAARQLPTDGTPAQAHLSHSGVGSTYAEDTPLARAGTAQAVSSGDVKVTAGDEIGDGNSVNEFLDRLQERGWIADSPPSTEDLAKVAAKAGDNSPQQRIPKIIHATWKTHVLPERWEKVRQGCIDLHPDYEFKLWSDADSRAFIAEHYPWFLPTFDGYTYPIQRADVIRYFVLHHFGGIYMDLDIGCRRNLDPLLYFRVILPQTIPVGVSNDLMFAEKGHPFMDLVIHNLITFDHTYGTNYPTVMFSTGPMFLSAVYGMWPKDTPDGVERHVRILPRRWYGKNAPVTEMEDSYFDHFYGSSWHADDAGFITFLGKFGIALMYAGVAVVVLGGIRIFWTKRPGFKSTPRQIGPIALPYEALPFARSGGSSSSRPGSPSGSRSATPAPRADGKVGGGGLFYMPVWLYPGDRTPGGRSPGDSQGAWTQYFSNLSFVDDGNGGHRYEPLPNFSRPPSPSNNSILHAPGSSHDGAFDGVHLHSIRPTSKPTDAPPSSYSEPPFTSPTSPNPPAYSALRSWGTSLFRGFPFPSPSSGPEPLLPVAHAAGTATSSGADRTGATTPTPRRRASADLVVDRDDGRNVPALSKQHEAARFHLSLPRARSPSPAPPRYSPHVAAGVGEQQRPGSPDDEGETVVDARSRPARTGSDGVVGRPSPGNVGAPPPTAAEAARHGSVERAASHAGGQDDVARGRRAQPPSPAAGGVGAHDLEDEVDAVLAADDDALTARAAGHEAVEAQVDRLLSEMAPDAVASSPSSPRLE